MTALATIFLSGALTGGVDVVCADSVNVIGPGQGGTIEFVTDWPADVHWFGAYLRKDADRYSVHPRSFVPGSYFAPLNPDEQGRNRFLFIIKPGFECPKRVDFLAKHTANPIPPDAAAIERLGRMEHPRLILKKGDDVFGRVRCAAETNALLAAAIAHMKKFADATLDQPTIKYRPDGRRLWTQPLTSRLFALAQMWKMYGDRRYLDRLEADLRETAAYPDWNPSHFIDTALFTFDFAIAYDWLYDDWSAEMRDLLANAILDKSLRVAEKDAFWIHNGNNWSQVCLCGMLAGAIAVAEREPELARRHIANAVSFLHEPVEAYAPFGAYPEGVGYWNFATTYQIFAIECMRTAFGTDFGLVSEPGFLQTGLFPDMIRGPSGYLFNHSDSGKTRHALPPLWWFARETGRPELVSVERGIDFRNYAIDPTPDANGYCPHGCEFCFIPLRWMVDVPEKGTTELPLSWWSGSSVPIAVVRTSRKDPNALWVAMKGGTCEASHGHADQGTFVLDALGERWVEDLGGGDYSIGEREHGMKFWDSGNDSPRWTYTRLGPQGHNVVTIEGEKANVVGFAPLHFCRSDKRHRTIDCDLSPVHPSVRSARRKGRISGDGTVFSVVDTFTGVKPGTVFVWRMNTRAKATIDGRNLVLDLNGKRMSVRASEGEWSVTELDLPRENPAKDIVQLHLRVKAEAETQSISVVFQPEQCDK